jgi:hypothetical protein
MTSSEAPEHPEAIRVTEALSGESTQEVGGDATNEAGPEDSQPAAAVLPTGNSTAMADEGERNPASTPQAAAVPCTAGALCQPSRQRWGRTHELCLDCSTGCTMQRGGPGRLPFQLASWLATAADIHPSLTRMQQALPLCS